MTLREKQLQTDATANVINDRREQAERDRLLGTASADSAALDDGRRATEAADAPEVAPAGDGQGRRRLRKLFP